MPYIIQRVADGKFVAMPGSLDSYVDDADTARQFPSFAEANHNRCPDNERIFYYVPGHFRLVIKDNG